MDTPSTNLQPHENSFDVVVHLQVLYATKFAKCCVSIVYLYTKTRFNFVYVLD